jgi:hypothetical protein
LIPEVRSRLFPSRALRGCPARGSAESEISCVCVLCGDLPCSGACQLLRLPHQLIECSCCFLRTGLHLRRALGCFRTLIGFAPGPPGGSDLRNSVQWVGPFLRRAIARSVTIQVEIATIRRPRAGGDAAPGKELVVKPRQVIRISVERAH